MDSMGSLVDTNLRIYPSNNLLDYLKSIPINDDVPLNIGRLVKGRNYEAKHKEAKEVVPVHLNSTDIENLNKIKAVMKFDDEVKEEEQEKVDEEPKKDNIDNDKQSTVSETTDPDEKALDKSKLNKEKDKKEKEELYLLTADIDWLYTYLQKQRKAKSDGDKDVPYLHVLLEGSSVKTPENQVLPRDPVLEARCVKLRAQQEAREYRKMTKGVDNVRMKFPEDSISYQLKQMNRQLIAIGQFIISIFAGFLFGFRGVEWLVGNLDFGFRLLLGVMCALVIALAEIYFLAKKLNEELNVPETVQLGGPPKFGESTNSQYYEPRSTRAIEKEHQD
ncbi:uncharacterized protein LOC118273197 [Spodoptera frugiperda]|uniref:Uncharacterized protein LOC118273197 n=1 Tax=Spodoptera frugiperda TaxID=7108 RepID=A0A9R0DXP3_SPOFR|nr:uncharacterized protein LOC118273197 [Spodoptera frugiperda]